MMQFLSYCQPMRWTRHIWKELRQVRTMALTVTLTQLGIQAIIVFVESWLRPASSKPSDLLVAVPLCALLTPIFLSVGCVGVMIGQERQSGTWNWHSSLPVSWIESLLGKLIACVFTTAVSVGFLLLIPYFFLPADRPAINETSANAWLFIATIFLEFLAIGSLCCLIFRETLTALVVAGFMLATVQGLLFILLSEVERNDAPRVVILGTGFILGGVSLLMIAYRKRWYATELVPARWNPFSYVSAAQLPQFTSSSRRPFGSEWSMLIMHSLRTSLGLRSALFIGGLAVCIVWSSPKDSAFAFVSLVAIGLMGLSTFEGDRTQNRFLFWADRGVNPRAMIVSRLVSTSLWAVIFVGLNFAICRSIAQFPGSVLDASYGWSYVALLASIFLLSALMSMVFPRPIFATIVSTGLIVGGIMIFEAKRSILEVPPVTGIHALIILAPGPVMLLCAILLLARRWLVQNDSMVTFLAASTAIIVVLLPSLIYFTALCPR